MHISSPETFTGGQERCTLATCRIQTVNTGATINTTCPHDSYDCWDAAMVLAETQPRPWPRAFLIGNPMGYEEEKGMTAANNGPQETAATSASNCYVVEVASATAAPSAVIVVVTTVGRCCHCRGGDIGHHFRPQLAAPSAAVAVAIAIGWTATVM